MKNEEFNKIFSQKLLSAAHYNCLRYFNGDGDPTNVGHGPFNKLTNNSIVFDLRLIDRPIYGHSHPLEIKTKVEEELNLLEKSFDYIGETQKIILNRNPELQKHHFFISNDIEYFKQNYTFLNSKNFSSIIKQDNLSSKKFLIKINAIDLLTRLKELNELFHFINENEINFGVIEENTIGTSYNDFAYKYFTKKTPSILISNFSLSSYCVFSDLNNRNLPNVEISTYNLIHTYRFIRFFYEINLFNETGRISKISNKILQLLIKYNLTMFKHSYLNIICDDKLFDLYNLKLNGILASKYGNQIIFSFPISIKDEHLSEIIEMLSKST